MASSFVKRYIKPGEPTRVTLPSTAAMVALNLDGKTRTIVLGEHVVEIREGNMVNFVPVEETGIHRDNTTRQWFAYLSEDEI